MPSNIVLSKVKKKRFQSRLFTARKTVQQSFRMINVRTMSACWERKTTLYAKKEHHRIVLLHMSCHTLKINIGFDPYWQKLEPHQNTKVWLLSCKDKELVGYMYRCIYVLCVNLSQGDAPGSVPQPKIAFPPCSNDCDGKCVDKCPDYCCVKVVASKTSGQTQPASAPQPSQVISIYGLGLICKVLLKHCIFQVA